MADDLPANWTRIMCDGLPVFEGVVELPDDLNLETNGRLTFMGVPVRILADGYVDGVRRIGVTTDLGDHP